MKNIALGLCAFLVLYFLTGDIAYSEKEISVGEAFEIAYKDASMHGIDLETYMCTIYVNATRHEMYEAPDSIVSEKQIKLFSKLKGKNYAAIEFKQKVLDAKRYYVTTYYIDLDTELIIDIVGST